MRRRDVIGLLSGAAAWPVTSWARQGRKSPLVGVLWHAGSAEEEDVYLPVLRKAFSDLGYVEDKNIHLEHRFPAEDPQRFRLLAQELVALEPDVIIAVTSLGAVEVKRATNSIPIVFVLATDPVRDGVVESLAHPGGNATGLSGMGLDLTAKRVELLKEAVPGLSRIGVLIDPTIRNREQAITAHQAAARQLGLSIGIVVEVGGVDDVAPAFDRLVADRVDGIAMGPGSQLFNLRKHIGPAALSHRLPGITNVAEALPYGLLLSYGVSLPDFFRRAVRYTDKILKGARPADLPVEQASKIRLVIDLRTAKALDIQIPRTLLVAADEIIE